MNLTVLLIAAYLPLPLVIFMILRSGSFGRGSIGMMLKLFFLGVAAAVPAFLMEAGGLLVVNILLRLFPENSFGGYLPVVSALLRYLLVSALIEEGWKHFVLRVSTWQQMTMETIADGVAAAALVGTGFSAVLYGAWQAAYLVIPEDMGVLHSALPDFLMSGPVTSFLFAIMFIFCHFGFSGFMGAIYGLAKSSEQKEHGKRAAFMLFISCLLPVLAHGFCAALIGFGMAGGKLMWFGIGLAAEVMLALLMAAVLSKASDSAGLDPGDSYEEKPVDFADSEEFASFAESAGTSDEYMAVADTGAAGSAPALEMAENTDPQDASDTINGAETPGTSDATAASGAADSDPSGFAENTGSDGASDAMKRMKDAGFSVADDTDL